MPAASRPTQPVAKTLKELAEVSGVSAATLSRVLNHPERVRPELRRRALEALASADYVPHAAARSLASRRSRTIGAVVPTIDSGFYAKLIEGLQRQLQRSGYRLLLSSCGYNAQQEAAEIRALVEHGVDAVLLVGRTRQRAVYEWLRTRVPFITSCHYDGPMEWPTLGWNNVDEAERMATYLLDLGHRSFAIITGSLKDNDRTTDRVAGFRLALSRQGLEIPDGCIVERPYSVQQGRLAMAALLRAPSPPTAVMCTNDVLAYGALQECLWRDIPVPGRMSITGFDDIEIAAQCRPAITTVRVPALEIGAQAADMLLARLKDTGSETEQICHQLELLVRGTTAPPAKR